MQPLLQRPDNVSIHHLQGGGDNTCGDDLRHHLTGRVDSAKGGQQGFYGLGLAEEANGDLRSDPQGPFGAGKETGEVIAWPVQRLTAKLENLSRCQDQLESEDMHRRGPVLQAVGAAGVLRYVAADAGGGLTCRIRGKVVAVILNPPGQGG